MTVRKTFPKGAFSTVHTSVPNSFINTRFEGTLNFTLVDDPYNNDAFDRVQAANSFMNPAVTAQIHQETAATRWERAYMVILPQPFLYSMWQPWVGAYYGEMNTLFNSNLYTVSRYVWIDQELKEAMGH